MTQPDAHELLDIARSTLPHLDGEYTVFGQVTSGLEILDKIEKDDELKRVTIIEM